MTQRLDLGTLAPDFYAAMSGVESAVQKSGIDPGLYELVKIRASQLNGCAFCLDMHLSAAREAGESQRRLDLLSAWREAESFYSDAERAALSLTEHITLIAEEGVPDDVWAAAVKALGEAGVAQVVQSAVVINSWNRLAVTIHQDLPHPRA